MTLFLTLLVSMAIGPFLLAGPLRLGVRGRVAGSAVAVAGFLAAWTAFVMPTQAMGGCRLTVDLVAYYLLGYSALSSALGAAFVGLAGVPWRAGGRMLIAVTGGGFAGGCLLLLFAAGAACSNSHLLAMFGPAFAALGLLLPWVSAGVALRRQ